MSKSVLLKSSIAKKYWMALTGLFLCLFLVGHLLGNLQLFAGGEEGKRAFNEYAYFMAHNPFIKIMSYLTYVSILFHAIDGILLTIENKKARPIPYAYSKPNANSKWYSRSMAVLGSIVMIFIVTHMASFWWKAKYSSAPFPIHQVTKTVDLPVGQNPMTGEMVTKPIEITYVLTTKGEYKEFRYFEPESKQEEVAFDIKNGTEFYDKKSGLKIGEGYKDLHSVVMAFFGQDKPDANLKANNMALGAVIFYVFAMLVLAFHLMHGFSSAFQSLGLNHPKYTPLIKTVGSAFAVLVPLAFASIPVFIFLTK